MKKSLARKALVLATLLSVVCMSGISLAENDSKSRPVKEKGPALLQLENAAGKKIEDVKVPEVPKPTPVPAPKPSSSLEGNKFAGVQSAAFFPAAGESATRGNNIVLCSNCIEKGLTCILNGTPCCAPYECKGKFPNTSCK